MSRDIGLYLEDIIEAADAINEYLEGYSFAQFAEDRRTFDAVVRQFEIIGEAVKQLPMEIKDTETEIPWKEIAGFRDVLAHAYFAIDESIVWDIAKTHLIDLIDACGRLKGRE